MKTSANLQKLGSDVGGSPSAKKGLKVRSCCYKDGNICKKKNKINLCHVCILTFHQCLFLKIANIWSQLERALWNQGQVEGHWWMRWMRRIDNKAAFDPWTLLWGRSGVDQGQMWIRLVWCQWHGGCMLFAHNRNPYRSPHPVCHSQWYDSLLPCDPFISTSLQPTRTPSNPVQSHL